jgi:hypothetical protein
MTDNDGKEQRRRRSEETVTAIRYQLEYVHEHFGIELAVFADIGGIELAHAGDDLAAELVAAFAAGLAEGDLSALDTIAEAYDGAHPDRLHTRTLDIDGLPMYLVAFADPGEKTVAAVDRAAAGILRIYRTTSLTAR